MINVKEFLLKNNLDFGTYTLITYNNKTDATWFSKQNYKGEDWFLESPCELYRIMKVEGDIQEFAKDYASSLIAEDDFESYAENYIIPMIVDGWLYEIENFQCSPYLPKEVDDIKLISEKECLEYLLNKKLRK